MTKTNWKKLKVLTEEEIEQAAKSDPDSYMPTREELKEFKELKELNPNWTVHPSETIWEILKDRKIPLRVFLDIEGIDIEKVSLFMQKLSSLSESDIKKVSQFLNISKDFLTNLQTNHLDFMKKNPDYVLE